jgi:putative methionine-R-sulfoxide reductase with GAF domain
MQNNPFFVYSKITARISTLAAAKLEFDHFARQVVEIIDETINPLFVGIFLIDNSGHWAVIRAGSGITGEKMAADLFKYSLFGNSPVSLAIQNANLEISYLPSPSIRKYLPESKLQYVLPIIYSGEVLGVLSIHYNHLDHPSSIEILTVQNTTDIIALSYQNSKTNREIRILQMQSERRTQLLRATNCFARLFTTQTKFESLLQDVVDLICQAYSKYYAGIFLIDEDREWAVLKVGFGSAGKIMIHNGHKLKIGGNSMAGMAIKLGEVRVAMDVGEERIHFKNPLLPLTRSEMALPLRYADQILGAITIQSREEDAFSQDDILSLQSLSDFLALTIHCHNEKIQNDPMDQE